MEDLVEGVEGGGLLGPGLELGGGLPHEHFGAGDGGAAGGAGFAEQSGFDGVVDGVEDDGARPPLVHDAGGGVDVGGHADGGAVDQDLGGRVGEVVERSGMSAEFVGEGLGAVGGAVVDGDVGTVVGEAGDDGAGGSACPDDGDGSIAQLVALDLKGVADGIESGGVVGVGGVEGTVVANGEGVGGPDCSGEGFDFAAALLDEPQQVLLVGDGDGGAAEVEGFHVEPVTDGGFEMFVFGWDGQRQVDAVVLDGVEAGVVDGRAHGVSDGIPDDAIDGGVGVEGVPSVEGFALLEGGLSRRGGGVVVECGEGEQGAELFGEDAGGQADVAHAQGDGGFVSLLDEFEGLKVVAQ